MRAPEPCELDARAWRRDGDATHDATAGTLHRLHDDGATLHLVADRQLCRLRLKTGKARSEQMSSDLPPIADIAQRGWHGRKVPGGDIVTGLIPLLGWLRGHKRCSLTYEQVA